MSKMPLVLVSLPREMVLFNQQPNQNNMKFSFYSFALFIIGISVLTSCAKPSPLAIDNLIDIDLSEINSEYSGQVLVKPKVDPNNEENIIITIENDNPQNFQVIFVPVDSHPLKIRDGGTKKVFGFLNIEAIDPPTSTPQANNIDYIVRIPKDESSDNLYYIMSFSSGYPMHYSKSSGIPHKHNRTFRIGDPRYY